MTDEPVAGTAIPAGAPRARRREIPERQRLLVWVRSGGCAMCGKYLLEGEVTGRVNAWGEMAHIVGQGRGAASPRGQVEMSDEDRDSADNLILLCPGSSSVGRASASQARPTSTFPTPETERCRAISARVLQVVSRSNASLELAEPAAAKPMSR